VAGDSVVVGCFFFLLAAERERSMARARAREQLMVERAAAE